MLYLSCWPFNNKESSKKICVKRLSNLKFLLFHIGESMRGKYRLSAAAVFGPVLYLRQHLVSLVGMSWR